MTREGAEVSALPSPPKGPQLTLFCQRCCAGSARSAGSSCAAGLAQMNLYTKAKIMGFSENNLGQAATQAQSLLWLGSHTWCGLVLPFCDIPRDLTACESCDLATVRLGAYDHREGCPNEQLQIKVEKKKLHLISEIRSSKQGLSGLSICMAPYTKWPSGQQPQLQAYATQMLINNCISFTSHSLKQVAPPPTPSPISQKPLK